MTVRIGLCSHAHIHASTYATILDQLDAVELVGLATERDGAEAFAREHDLVLLDRETLLDVADAVVVASTNADRERWVVPAAEGGVDVLCEKPLAPSAATAAQLDSACREARVTLAMAMPLRHCVPAVQAKELLTDDVIGDLKAVCGTNRGLLPGGWFRDPEAAGGGAVMDHTVHVVDLVHWLTGERVDTVYADTATRFHDGPLEDVNLLSMTLTDGTAFSLDGSWSKPEGWRFWGDATVELVGTAGTLAVNCFDEILRSSTVEGGETEVFVGQDPTERLLRSFVAAVCGKSAPDLATGTDGVEAVRVIEAAYESATRGHEVAVNR